MKPDAQERKSKENQLPKANKQTKLETGAKVETQKSAA
jgi:hypothetical protein